MSNEVDTSFHTKTPLTLQKKRINIYVDVSTINYFKELSEDTGIPYQTLMNSCLKEYVQRKKKAYERN